MLSEFIEPTTFQKLVPFPVQVNRIRRLLGSSVNAFGNLGSDGNGIIFLKGNGLTDWDDGRRPK